MKNKINQSAEEEKERKSEIDNKRVKGLQIIDDAMIPNGLLYPKGWYIQLLPQGMKRDKDCYDDDKLL